MRIIHDNEIHALLGATGGGVEPAAIEATADNVAVQRPVAPAPDTSPFRQFVVNERGGTAHPRAGHGHEEGKGFDGYQRHVADGDSAARAEQSTTHDEGILTVTVGGSVSGTINTTGDVDLVRVDLLAGETYSFYVYGSGANAVNDTFLQLIAPNGSTLLREDDDGGIGIYSLITYTATATGTYNLNVSSFNNPGDPGLGDWTLTVHQRGPDEAPSAPPSAVAASLGNNYGFLTAGDEDVYSIQLTAGFIYKFEVAAGADYNTDDAAVPTGEVDTIIRIYNAAGVVVYSNDDIDYPNDISSAVGFIASDSGTYYVEVDGYGSQSGGYVLNISETNPADLDPLDAINWGGNDNKVDNSDTLLIYFAAEDEVYDGVTDLGGWTTYLEGQVLAAFQTYSQFADLTFAITTDKTEADFILVTTESDDYLAYFNPPGETNAGVGVFAINGTGWDDDGTAGTMEPGGYGWITLVHEIGHGLGLAHPHDTGGGSEVMPGVTGPFDSLGIFDMNQGVYTMMSYNDGWQRHPDIAPNGFPVPLTLDYGFQATPMALDIAMIQAKYGAVSANTGNNVYVLQTENLAGTFYQAIWDTGGTDEIRFEGTVDAVINLTAATLDYSATGAGAISWVDGVFGGFTIANGVVIENATGGSGGDRLIGNGAANVLHGRGGDDIIIGGAGDDVIDGGTGINTAVFSGNFADYTIANTILGVTVTDNNAADGDDGTDTLTDIRYLQFADQTINLDDAPGNQTPVLTGVAASVTFLENVVNGGAQLLDGDVSFSDSDDNFDAGTIVVSGGLAEDTIRVRNEGTGAGQVGVSGANITYSGVVVGTFAGGTGGTALTITLNAAANSIAVDQILENLTYANSSNTPTVMRTLTIVVTDDEGEDVASTIAVEVTPQNDAPSGANATVTGSEDDALVLTAANFGFSDVDGNSFAGVVITTLPIGGSLRLNGVAVTAGQFVSAASIAANELIFTGAPDAYGSPYANFTFQVRDNGGTANGGQNTDQTPNTLTINLTPDNDGPVLTGLATNVTFDENVVNSGGQLIDADVTFTDSNGDFNGGTIVVSGALAQDVVAVRNEGTGAGQVGVSGSNVTYGGIIVGTLAGGTGGTALTITLTAAATSVSVEEILENLTFANSSDNPAATRTLTINVTDAAGNDLVRLGTVSYAEQTGAADPLAGLPVFGAGPTLAFVDVDNDGDLDIVVGDQPGALRYFNNNAGTYTEVTGAANPFSGQVAGAVTYSSPTAIDIDGDGDKDLVFGGAGAAGGQFGTFRNNGNGTWTQLTGAANPFDGIDIGNFSDPGAGDYDGDGDEDLIAGNSDGTISFIQNNGGVFTLLTGAAQPITTDVGAYSSVTAGDVDRDGDVDVVVGTSAGTILTFLNNGAGLFSAAVGAANPFNGIDVGSYSLPTLVDIDGDGDMDLVVGDSAGGDTRVWLNTTPAASAPKVTVNITAQNDAPVVDLNGAGAGRGYAATYTEDGAGIAIGSGITITDPDAGDMIESARVRLLNVQPGDVLTIAGTLPAGITASYATVGANYVLTLTGTASAAAYATAIGQVRYSSTSQDPAAGGTTPTRTIDVRVSDGDDNSNSPDAVITVISVDDPSVARPDAFTIGDSAVLTGNLLANNGFGADSDVDSPVESVRLVGGSRASIGEFFTLASGARLRVNANGTFTYDTNGAYTSLAAAGSGAVNTQATETFTYTLENGSTATVTIRINGVDNADFLQGTAASETLLGGVMDDTLMGGMGADSLIGGSGTDTASYADDFGAVFVNLTLGVGSGNAAAGDVYTSIENVIGSSFNDTIIGENGVNVLDGRGGDDVLIGSLGADVLIGGSGSDTASYGDNQGSVFVNLSLGRGFNNAAEGDTYNGIENLQGSVFDDYLLGDDAANRLDGGMGADVLYGFGGADTFVFRHAASATSDFGGANVDTIADFVSGVDKIELSQAAYGALSLGTLSSSAFTTGTAATSGDHRIVYNSATGQLYYDADGSGVGAAVLFAVLDTKPAITATDFIIAA